MCGQKFDRFLLSFIDRERWGHQIHATSALPPCCCLDSHQFQLEQRLVGLRDFFSRWSMEVLAAAGADVMSSTPCCGCSEE